MGSLLKSLTVLFCYFSNFLLLFFKKPGLGKVGNGDDVADDDEDETEEDQYGVALGHGLLAQDEDEVEDDQQDQQRQKDANDYLAPCRIHI